jgi:hypothetical protein
MPQRPAPQARIRQRQHPEERGRRRRRRRRRRSMICGRESERKTRDAEKHPAAALLTGSHRARFEVLAAAAIVVASSSHCRIQYTAGTACSHTPHQRAARQHTHDALPLGVHSRIIACITIACSINTTWPRSLSSVKKAGAVAA